MKKLGSNRQFCVAGTLCGVLILMFITALAVNTHFERRS